MKNGQLAAQAQTDLPTASAAFQRVTAAYMTLGSEGYQKFAADEAYTLYTVELDLDAYTSNAMTDLDVDGNPDADGAWNRLEWKTLLEELTGAPTLTDAEAYADMALDPESPEAADINYARDVPQAPPNQPEYMDWPYDWLPQAQVTFASTAGLALEAHVIDPPGRAEEALPLDELVILPVGSEVIVSVKGSAELDWFYRWDAPGTLIDGSAEPAERFHVPPQGTTVQPIKRGISSVTIPTSPLYQVTWDGVGPMGHLVEAGPDNTVLVPEGAFLNIHATRDKFMLAGWTGLATDREWTSYTPSTNMRADVDSFEPWFVQTLGPLFTGYLTHTIRPGEGGAAFGGIEDRATHYGDGLQYGNFRTYDFHPSMPFYWSYVKLDAKADLGYEFSHWIADDNGPAIGTPPMLAYSRDTRARSALAKYAKMLGLTIKIKAGDADAASAQSGHVVVSEARKYYSALDTTYLQLKAYAHPCYCFIRWSGDGIAYPNTDFYGVDGPDLDNPISLSDQQNPATDTTIWIAMAGKDRVVIAHFQALEVQITHAEITEDRIDVSLQPETYSGTLELRVTGPGGVSHVIRCETRTGGQYQETFDIPNLPVEEFTNVEAWWGCERTLQTRPCHFQNLGVYRHSQYNTPNENDNTCAGTPVSVCIFDSHCVNVIGTLCNTFAAEVWENGSGISTSYGTIQREWECPGCTEEYRFRTVGPIQPSCAGRGLGDTTVARGPGNRDLGCGDRVLIVGLGEDVGTVKTVTDLGGDVDLTQLDNYTANGACSGVFDLGNFLTIKLF